MTFDRLRDLLLPGACCLLLATATLEAQGASAAPAPAAAPADATRTGEGGASEPLPAPVPKPRTAKKKPAAKPGLIARDASFAEMEAVIVSGTGLYVVLDPQHKVLEVRSRGLVLDRVHLSGIEFLSHSPIFGGGADTIPSLPATWVVAEDASDFEREVIAPDTLRSYVPEDQRTALDEARNPKVIAAHEEGALPPSTYQVKLTNGWALAVLDQAPKTNFFARFNEAMREGWKRLRGVKSNHPAILAVAMSGEDAQRIHHLFRADLPVLIAPGKS